MITRNMLVPVGVTSQRQRAKFIVRVYRADGLPRYCRLLLKNHNQEEKDENDDSLSRYVKTGWTPLLWQIWNTLLEPLAETWLVLGRWLLLASWNFYRKLISFLCQVSPYVQVSFAGLSVWLHGCIWSNIWLHMMYSIACLHASLLTFMLI